MNSLLVIQIALGLAVLADLACLFIIIIMKRDVDHIKNSASGTQNVIHGLNDSVDELFKVQNNMRKELDLMSVQRKDSNQDSEGISSESRSESDKSEPNVHIEQIHTLYANAAIDASGILGSVNETPIGNSIYELSLDSSNPKRATFKIYSGAVSRVIEEPSFLDYVCHIEAFGERSQLDSQKVGTVEEISPGRWRVIDQINVKFR